MNGVEANPALIFERRHRLDVAGMRTHLAPQDLPLAGTFCPAPTDLGPRPDYRDGLLALAAVAFLEAV